MFKPRDVKTSSRHQRREALNLITMIKETRDGKIKGRACADGRKQRRYISRDDVSSPTIQLESLMITLLVDGYEHRDVATADFVGAYLLAKMDDFILVKVDGTSADIMRRVNPAFNKFVTKVRGKHYTYS